MLHMKLYTRVYSSHLYKIVLLIIVILYLPGVIRAQQAPCSTEQHRQFDFWVGDWEVMNQDDQVIGHSKVELILNDCVIFENWQSANPGYAGKSLNYFNRSTNKWNQKWIDTNGIPIEFEGVFNKQDQALYYTATTKDREGKEVLNKLSFYKKSKDYVNQIWEQSIDKGKTWTTVFDGHYKKTN